MTWAAWGPTIATLVAWIFIAGQVTGRIKSQEITLKEHHDRLDGHDEKLENHAERLTAAEAYQRGYSDGRRKGAPV
jgi:hypothetical protein